MMYVIEVVSYGMIYIPSFIKLFSGVHEVLRFCLSVLRGCNVGITDRTDL
jgi:hypothetical protein